MDIKKNGGTAIMQAPAGSPPQREIEHQGCQFCAVCEDTQQHTLPCQAGTFAIRELNQIEHRGIIMEFISARRADVAVVFATTVARSRPHL